MSYQMCPVPPGASQAQWTHSNRGSEQVPVRPPQLCTNCIPWPDPAPLPHGGPCKAGPCFPTEKSSLVSFLCYTLRDGAASKHVLGLYFLLRPHVTLAPCLTLFRTA